MASDLRIVEVLDATFDLHLMNRTGNFGDVEKIYATAADHALCERFLAALSPRALGARREDAAHGLPARRRGPRRRRHRQRDASAASSGLEVARRNVLDAGGDRVRYAVVGPRPRAARATT